MSLAVFTPKQLPSVTIQMGATIEEIQNALTHLHKDSQFVEMEQIRTPAVQAWKLVFSNYSG